MYVGDVVTRGENCIFFIVVYYSCTLYNHPVLYARVCPEWIVECGSVSK